MKTYVNVPCPRCGANLDVPVIAEGIALETHPPRAGEFGPYMNYVVVAFDDQRIEHQCKS